MTDHLHQEYLYWDQKQSNADDEMRFQLVKGLSAKLSKRRPGEWCWLIGDSIDEGVAGFGTSPRAALDDLWKNFHSDAQPSQESRE